MHQDHLSGTSLTTDSSGNEVATIKYLPFGGTRLETGTLDTDKRFTSQRLDESGLYFYNARYYDATIGRFISPDSIVPDWTNPQSWNKYSYVLNNPLKYIDPTGHWPNPIKWIEEEIVEPTVGALQDAVGWTEDNIAEPLVGDIQTAIGQFRNNAVKTLAGVAQAATSWTVDFVVDEALEPAASFTVDKTLDVVSYAADKIIPEGYTVGIGINLQGGLILGGSFTAMLVLDGSGSVGFLYSSGGGNYIGAGGSACLQLQLTNAYDIRELAGVSTQIGGSVGRGPVGAGSELVFGETYRGYNVMGGYPVGPIPVEGHSINERGTVIVLRE